MSVINVLFLYLLIASIDEAYYSFDVATPTILYFTVRLPPCNRRSYRFRPLCL